MYFDFMVLGTTKSTNILFFRSCVPNVLLTSCVDNICRVWSETVKYKPSHHNNERKHVHTEKVDGSAKTEQHVPDERLHHQRYHLVSMFHFHLAAVINPSMDIALLSTIPTSSIFGRCFQLEWLNNKEVQFTTAGINLRFCNFNRRDENID